MVFLKKDCKVVHESVIEGNPHHTVGAEKTYEGIDSRRAEALLLFLCDNQRSTHEERELVHVLQRYAGTFRNRVERVVGNMERDVYLCL